MASIVVFDGECGLCNGFVAWLIRHDRAGVFLLAGSDGVVGREVIRRAGLPENIGESTLIVWDGRRAATQSDAVLAVASQLPWPWRATKAGRIVPRSWRDTLYRTIAARRPRIAADDPSCGVPPPKLVRRWRERLATVADV